MSGTRLARSSILAGVFAALAACLVFFVTAPYGPGASPDSVTYLSVARSVADGEGWVRFDGRPYVAWPPLYPMLLALGVGAGLEPVASARVLGALSGAVTLALLVLTLARVTGSLAWAALGGLLALASPPVIETYATAWSEGPFTALMSLAFWLALRVEPEPQRRHALGLGVVLGAVCLTRHVGFVLAGAVGAWLLVLPAARSERLLRASLFAGVTAIGPLAWALRNLAVTGTAAGGRGGAAAPLAENAGEFAASLASLLSLDALGAARLVLAAALVLGLAALGLAVAWRARPQPPAIPTLPALFILLYVAAMVGLATWTPVSPLFGQRFGMPVWIPFVLVVTTLAAAAWQRTPARGPRIALAVALALPSLNAVAAAGIRIGEHRERGVVILGRAEWHGSGLIDAVRSRRPGTTVLSNNPHAVSFHTGFPVDYAPHRRGFRSEAAEAGTLAELRRRVAAEGSVPLAWFLFYGQGYGYYTPKELAAEGFCVLGRDELADGIYFEITDPARCPGPRLVPPRPRVAPPGSRAPAAGR